MYRFPRSVRALALIALSIICLPVAAWAQQVEDTWVRPWEEISKEQKMRVKLPIVAAALVDFEDGLNCSGTFVSNEGHLLTALHCLNGCNWEDPQKKGFDVTPYLVSHDRQNDIQSYTYEPSVFRGSTCRARVNGVARTLVFIGSGRGKLWPFFADKIHDPKNLPTWMKLVSKGYGAGGDFALFQIKDSGRTACASLSEIPLKEGERLEDLSFPIYEGNRTKSERDGTKRFYAHGIEATQKLASSRPELPTNIFFHTTMYCDVGSSGSGIYGEDGVLKGVAVQALDTFQTGSKSFCTGIRIEAIRNILKKVWNFELPTCSPE